MLTAGYSGGRIEARFAPRKGKYHCPECEQAVILHQGTKIAAHFKHKRADRCLWAAGETLAHLRAKQIVADEFSKRGLVTKIECVVDTMPGDRRADVMIWTAGETRLAFEVQHTALDPREISIRAGAYARTGIRQCWIPFLRQNVWEKGRAVEGGWKMARYLPRPYESWLHTFYRDGVWMYDPATESFWLATLAPHMLHKPERSYIDQSGDEVWGGGYDYEAENLRDLSLAGPYRLSDLEVVRKHVPDRLIRPHHWPDAWVAFFRPRGNDGGAQSEA